MQITVMAVMTRRISAATGTAAATRMVSFMLSNSTREGSETSANGRDGCGYGCGLTWIKPAIIKVLKALFAGQ